ncbi:ADP-ribosylation factor-like protein 13B isoform X1 [Schistocerca piceifrons]|uniref:ADP-ribosylation factor-like protein 13B isoform X1 n=2 Tax=Schistocerca piceifrons TaxID=274613 RepID=UPI001F5EE891|nr:ADP-ribosylation factor-like protein 13B isoform X1 [Schistocerca piceifrons]
MWFIFLFLWFKVNPDASSRSSYNMGNCSCCRRSNKVGPSSESHKKIVLILVGLDNAGKTTVVKRLTGEPVKTVLPTVGFSSASLKYKGYNVKIYDLGGGRQIRGIWPKYFMDAHGVIFVVDASDIARLEECKLAFEGLLSHEKLTGKPVLLLANKQDCIGALDELDIVERLNVESVVNDQRCPTLVETCSAAMERSSKQKTDPAIQSGYRWLMNCIISNYQNLNARVERDVTEQKMLDDEAKKERLERVQKLRQERGEIANENGGLDVNHQEHQSSDGDVATENPFRPISQVVAIDAEDAAKKDTLELVHDTGYPNVLSETGNSKRFVKRVSNGSISFAEDNSLFSKIRTSLDTTVHKAVKATASASETVGDQQNSERRGSAKASPSTTLGPVTASGGDKIVQLPPLRLPGRHATEPWAKPPMLRPPSRDSAWDLDKSLEVVPAPEGTAAQKEEKS